MSDLQRGNRLHAQRKYEAALGAFLSHARKIPEKASDAYAKAAKSCQLISVLSSPMEIESGVTLVFQGNRKTSRALFEKALSLNPHHFESLIGLAELLPRKSEERLEVMERAVAIQPHYMTLIEIGDFYCKVHSDFYRAYDVYKTAIERSPKDKTVYQRLSTICQQLGRDEEATNWKAKWEEVYRKKRKVGPAAGERNTN